MNLADLQYAPELILSAPTVLYRIQRLRPRPGGIAIGPLRVPPPRPLSSRFDLPDTPVGYLAESAEAAVSSGMR